MHNHYECQDALQQQNDGLVTAYEGPCWCENMGEISEGEQIWGMGKGNSEA